MKKKDIEQLVQMEHKLWEEVRELISGDRFVDYLSKVYKKRIRRSKKKPADRPRTYDAPCASLIAKTCN